MLFCETFQIKTEVKRNWKASETTATPTHIHTPGATTQLSVTLVSLSSVRKHTDTE